MRRESGRAACRCRPGQKQRVGLARAVFGDPFLLVLDEPNANLDADGENALTRAIGIMRQNKSIVVVISHRPSALSALDMTMVLYEGKAIAFGPSAEVFARVRNAGGKGVPGSPQPPPQAKAEQRAVTCRECFIMKGFDHVHADERVARRRFGGTDEDAAAPQGQALILELQRLRQAFEHDNQQDQRPPLRRPANDERTSGRAASAPGPAEAVEKERQDGTGAGLARPVRIPVRGSRSRAAGAARRTQHARAAVHDPAAGGRHARPDRQCFGNIASAIFLAE